MGSKKKAKKKAAPKKKAKAKPKAKPKKKVKKLFTKPLPVLPVGGGTDAELSQVADDMSDDSMGFEADEESFDAGADDDDGLI